MGIPGSQSVNRNSTMDEEDERLSKIQNTIQKPLLRGANKMTTQPELYANVSSPTTDKTAIEAKNTVHSIDGTPNGQDSSTDQVEDIRGKISNEKEVAFHTLEVRKYLGYAETSANAGD